MMQCEATGPNNGPIVVTCDNPQHETRRFSTVALAESFLLGNAVFGDCLHNHHIFEEYDVNPDAADEGTDMHAVAMSELGDLLASLMPAEGDNDDCGMVL